MGLFAHSNIVPEILQGGCRPCGALLLIFLNNWKEYSTKLCQIHEAALNWRPAAAPYAAMPPEGADLPAAADSSAVSGALASTEDFLLFCQRRKKIPCTY